MKKIALSITMVALCFSTSQLMAQDDEFDITIEKKENKLFERGGAGTYGTALSKVANFVSINGFANNQFIASKDQTSFEQSEVNLFVTGILSDKITTEFNIDFELESVEVEYAFLDYKFDPRAVLRVGKFLLPTSDFNEYSTYAYLNKSVGSPLSTLASPDRWSNVGIQLRGKFGDENSKIRPYYGVYIINGLAANHAIEISEEAGAMRELEEGGELLDNNENKGIGGQFGVEYNKNLFASLSYQTSKYDSAENLSVGVFGVSTGYDDGKAHISAEYHTTNLDELNGGIKETDELTGYFVLAAYKVNKFEPVVRFDHFHGKLVEVDRVTFGLNYYFLTAGNGMLKLNYAAVDGDTDDHDFFEAGLVFTF